MSHLTATGVSWSGALGSLGITALNEQNSGRIVWAYFFPMRLTGHADADADADGAADVDDDADAVAWSGVACNQIIFEYADRRVCLLAASEVVSLRLPVCAKSADLWLPTVTACTPQCSFWVPHKFPSLKFAQTIH